MRPEARRKPRHAGDLASTLATQTKSECDYIARREPCESRSAANDEVRGSEVQRTHIGDCDAGLADLLDRIAGLSGDGLATVLCRSSISLCLLASNASELTPPKYEWRRRALSKPLMYAP